MSSDWAYEQESQLFNEIEEKLRGSFSSRVEARKMFTTALREVERRGMERASEIASKYAIKHEEQAGRYWSPSRSRAGHKALAANEITEAIEQAREARDVE